MGRNHRTGETPTPLTTPSVAEMSAACQSTCPAVKQVERWKGGLSLGQGIGAIMLTALLALVGWTIWNYKASTRQIVHEVVPAEVRAAMTEEFARYFGRASIPGRFERDLDKAAWQVIPSAQAADRGVK